MGQGDREAQVRRILHAVVCVLTGPTRLGAAGATYVDRVYSDRRLRKFQRTFIPPPRLE